MSKILVVDDEPDVEALVRQRFRRRIRKGELDFTFAGDGAEALTILEGEGAEVEMVLTDINMPRMDGLTLLDQIARVDPMLKAVVVSAYGDMKNIRTAMNRGAFDFVTKPIDFQDLEVTIDKTLDHLALLRDALQSRDRLVALSRELDVARDLQQSLVPRRFPEIPGHDMDGIMRPARQVGGDFYDVRPLPDGRQALAIADVSGKGMPAALFMTMSHAFLTASTSGDCSPGRCLARVNALLEANNEACMFVTVFLAHYDPASGALVYANAGHNAPMIVGADGAVREIPGTGSMALGPMEQPDYPERQETLGEGEMLLLFTDGITEAFSPDDEMFGEARLTETLSSGAGSSASDQIDRVVTAVDAFADTAPQADDLTCLAIRRQVTGSPS